MNYADTIVPLAPRRTNTAVCTPLWYVHNSEYHPVLCTYDPLINGEEAFRAVHLAIAAATKSIDIICWGFQPSMYLIRDRSAPCLGELLEIKAREGVKVRVLGWEMPLNLAGVAGEANLPGKAPYIATRALQNSTEQQRKYDQVWFSKYAGADTEIAYHLGIKAPLFVSRGFSPVDRLKIGWEAAVSAHDSEVGLGMLSALIGAVTHHQKSVMVDYEAPETAVGFVMGHNLLDEYWDTNDHSALNRTQYTWPEPNAGARGFTPRQDISSRVTGPILEHLHHNFATAWEHETGENLMQLRDAKHLGRQLKCGSGTMQIGQLLRTQAQAGRRDIEQVYLQAVNNATQFIYIENQYFRWPPLAEAIKKGALQQTKAGRDPGLHGALHLFVITNATDDGIGSGTVNTQRMLECLGRADTIPEITKLRRIEKAHGEKLSPQELERKVAEINQSTISKQPIPGLKVHVCSLVAGDSPAGLPWTPVYVHSKLMIVDDVFTTHGSANINTRSMQVDSELNIAHEWGSVTQALRRRLWGMHTGGMGMQDDPAEAFKEWDHLIVKNYHLQNSKLQPCVPLIEFYYGAASLSNLD